ncbi:MAG: hypothetical protein PW735_07710 [Acidobacteriaceae bacterium]|nr:hypothetical protein [Acidobacteriaceae bacterium]
MKRSLSHAAAIMLLTASAAACAQISDPNKLVAPAPRNPASHRALPQKTTGNEQWLWEFTRPEPNGRAYALRVDARFQQLLSENFKQPQAMWGTDEHRLALPQLIPLFLDRYGEALAEKNRYFIADGCVPRFCPAQGLLWIDLGQKTPLMVFAAVNWTATAHTTDQAAAEYNLWLFPNRTLSADSIPLALSEAIAHWNMRLAAAHRLVPHIEHALLVEPDGSPFALTPELVGANTLAPQPDTVTPKPADSE